jgi:hypothetical protein
LRLQSELLFVGKRLREIVNPIDEIHSDLPRFQISMAPDLAHRALPFLRA